MGILLAKKEQRKKRRKTHIKQRITIEILQTEMRQRTRVSQKEHRGQELISTKRRRRRRSARIQTNLCDLIFKIVRVGTRLAIHKTQHKSIVRVNRHPATRAQAQDANTRLLALTMPRPWPDRNKIKQAAVRERQVKIATHPTPRKSKGAEDFGPAISVLLIMLLGWTKMRVCCRHKPQLDYTRPSR